MSSVRPFYFRSNLAAEGVKCEPFYIDKINVRKEIERLDREIVAVQQSADFQKFFDVFSKFHRYSFRNTLLILWQYPNATMVAGYHQWRKRWNRQVEKGEKGIRIIAPIMTKHTRVVVEDEEEHLQTYLAPSGYDVVCVFDINQTKQIKGKPIKITDAVVRGPDVSTTKDLARYKRILEAHLKNEQIPVIYQPIGVLGRSTGQTNGEIIEIRNDLSETEQFFVIIHEYAHYTLHYERVEFKDPVTGRKSSRIERIKEYNREKKELQAEAVVYIVGTALNLFIAEVAVYRDEALRYLASWQKKEKLIDSLRQVHDISREVIQVLSSEATIIDSQPGGAQVKKGTKGKVYRTIF